MIELRAIEKLVARLSPAPVCDDCIAETLGASPLADGDHGARALARELAGANGFEMLSGACSLCGETRLVIRRH